MVENLPAIGDNRYDLEFMWTWVIVDLRALCAAGTVIACRSPDRWGRRARAYRCEGLGGGCGALALQRRRLY